MDNIETKINMLYEFIYSKSSQDNNNIKDFKIDEENISIDDIKIKFEGDKYDDILTELFLGKFKMIDFDETTNNLILKRYTDGLSIALYITPYNNEHSSNNEHSFNEMNNNDCLFSYILSSLVLGKKTKHIALPILNTDIKISQMNDIIKPYEEVYKKYMDMIEKQEISNILSVRVKENFFKSMQLTEFLISPNINIKKLLFQVIHTLAVLQKAYPGFRHNMLNPSNIYVYLKKDNNDIYEINKNTYYIPDNNFEIKITNFFAANIPNMYGSDQISIHGSLNIPFFDDKNDYFDLHYFLNNLLNIVDTMDEETMKFMNKVIPEEYRVTKKKPTDFYLKELEELFIPEELLEDKYFSEFKNEIKVERTMSADNYYTNINKSSRKSSISGSRKSNIDNHSSRKSSISGSSSKNIIQDMTGGATFYHTPTKKVHNNPFISNDKKNVYKRDYVKPEEKKPEDPDKDLIMRQEIRTNPAYVKPYKVKEKPTWDPEYKPIPKPDIVPQAKVHYDEKPDESKIITNNNEEKVSSSSSSSSSSSESESDTKPEKKVKIDKYVEKMYPEKEQRNNIDNTYTKPEKKVKIDKYVEKMYPEKEQERNYNNTDTKPEKKVKIDEYLENMYPNAEQKKPYNKDDRQSRPYNKFNTDDRQSRPYNKFNTDDRQSRPYNNERSYSPPNDRQSRPYNNERSYSPSNDRPSYSKEYQQKTKYQSNITEQPVIAEQKMYQTPQQNFPPGVLHTHPKYSNPAFIPIDNQITYPPAFVPDMANYFPFNGVPLLKPNELPLQKIYNINLGAPGYNHTLLNNIYQDVLPGDPNVYTMNSVYERMQIMNLLRNSMIKLHDGEDMTLQAGPNSLMEFIRILDFNPYALGRNKYQTVPINFMLYNGAYPIRFNTESRNIEIAKQSMGLNIRIYMLSEGALNNNIDITLTAHNFDVWRELSYYKYVKETILQKKVSPNFISMILYKFDRVSKINYDELKKVITTHVNHATILRSLNNYKEINTEINKLLTNTKAAISSVISTSSAIPSTTDPLDVTKDSKVSLLAITEAPTFNLLEWASPTYELGGMVSKQLTTGFHTTEVWRSVLFQLVSAMAVLQKKEILFRNFSIENNVFIKDLFRDPNNTGHWIYTVNNIDMYVPNFGHLVVIDSRFADVNPPTGVTGVFKIYSPTLFNENGNILSDESIIDNKIMADLKKILLRSNFTSIRYKSYGLVTPDDDILNLLDCICNSTASKISDILIECFPQYIHNRVGTLLNITEKTGISPTVMPKLNIGKLVVYQSRYDEYTWAIYNQDNGKKKEILLKDINGKLIKKDVFSHSLLEHPDANNIMQTSERTFRLNKESLIDTYNINN